jgi:hypothetical protein
MKEKVDKLNFIKLKSVFSANKTKQKLLLCKDMIKRTERQTGHGDVHL